MITRQAKVMITFRSKRKYGGNIDCKKFEKMELDIISLRIFHSKSCFNFK